MLNRETIAGLGLQQDGVPDVINTLSSPSITQTATATQTVTATQTATSTPLPTAARNADGARSAGEAVGDMAADSANQIQDILVEFQKIQFGQILFIIIIAIVLTWLLRRFLIWLSNQVQSRFRFYILPLIPILRILIVLFTFYLVATRLIDFSAISPSNIFAVLGAASVAIGFAFKDYVSSIIAGIVALYERPYRIGDWIEIDGDYGEVQAHGVRAVRILTPDDTVVSIPHQKLWTENVANANDGQREHMCVADLYLYPDHDARLVRQKLLDVIATSPYTQLNATRTVIVLEKPWGTHYRLKAYPIDGRDEFQFISDLTVRGREALADLGVRHAVAPPVADVASNSGAGGTST